MTTIELSGEGQNRGVVENCGGGGTVCLSDIAAEAIGLSIICSLDAFDKLIQST